jgi:transposase
MSLDGTFGTWVRDLRPCPTDPHSCAAQLLISWSHPGRFRSKAAFAMLAGAAPVEASSGQVVRHRLNRGGDRQLNRALHTIVMLRQTHHGPTRAYTNRRIAQGKSEREIRRCLKRTVARQLYRLLERTATGQASS